MTALTALIVGAVGAAFATTSVEGNCELTVTPLATGPAVVTSTTITITWTDNCTNVSTYSLERSADSGVSWTTVQTGYTTTRLTPPEQDGTMTDSPTGCGTYIYRIDAVHSPGNALPKVSISLNSNPVTLNTSNSSCSGGGIITGTCNQLTGALTLGYYSNKNGQATITGADLTTLDSLNLVNADGSPFNPTSASQMRSWLLNATAKNMSYMLSVQLAALQLTVDHGLVNPNSTLCEVPGTPTIGDVMADANNYLGANPLVLQPSNGGDPSIRQAGDALQTLLNEINNNLVSVE